MHWCMCKPFTRATVIHQNLQEATLTAYPHHHRQIMFHNISPYFTPEDCRQTVLPIGCLFQSVSPIKYNIIQNIPPNILLNKMFYKTTKKI
uniref:Uncharacterized protein n=1 Tax=Anguilla anguilla TaxID=7936 RepID=A0A0E9URG8_ANGAN